MSSAIANWRNIDNEIEERTPRSTGHNHTTLLQSRACGQVGYECRTAKDQVGNLDVLSLLSVDESLQLESCGVTNNICPHETGAHWSIGVEAFGESPLGDRPGNGAIDLELPRRDVVPYGICGDVV